MYFKKSSRTLHTDGTSKSGTYGTYGVVTEQGQTPTASVWKVSSGDAETQLGVPYYNFSEIKESLQKSEENVSNKIISKINMLCFCQQ